MCGCSGAGAKSPMAEFIKSQSPQEQWKASLKPDDPLKPKDPAKLTDDPSDSPAVQAAKAPGTGLLVDRSA